MGTFFSLFSGALSCIFYGFVITAFTVVTLYFLLSTASKGIVKTVPFFISFTFLFILLWANMSIMVGAIQLKSSTKAMEVWLTQQLDGYYGPVNLQESQEIGDMLDESFPILGHFLNIFDFSGADIEDLPHIFAEVINEEMNNQIWNNILWSIGFIVAAVLVSLYFDKGNDYGTQRGRKIKYARNNRIIINRPRHGKPHLNRNRRNRI